jgi:hypothetical protein
LAAITAFIVALWLTTPPSDTSPPIVAMLARASVSDAATLMATVQSAGLRGTPDLKGAIDEIKRVDDEHVLLKGWAFDATASSTSLTLVAFSAGAHVLTTTTTGARIDVTHIFGLDAGAANMSFHGSFSCKARDKVFVLLVTSDRRYSHLRSLTCP